MGINKLKKSKITGIGFHVPEQLVTNQDLTSIMDTSDEWIRTRSGIEQRRWVQGDEAASDLAIPASIKAMEMAGVVSEAGHNGQREVIAPPPV